MPAHSGTDLHLRDLDRRIVKQLPALFDDRNELLKECHRIAKHELTLFAQTRKLVFESIGLNSELVWDGCRACPSVDDMFLQSLELVSG